MIKLQIIKIISFDVNQKKKDNIKLTKMGLSIS